MLRVLYCLSYIELMPLPPKCFFGGILYIIIYIYTPACAYFKGQDATYGPSKIQVADLLRTPFTNAEKWRFALNLMSHVASKRAEPRETEKPQSASPGKPRPLWRAEAPGNQGCLSTQRQPCRDHLNGRHRKVRSSTGRRSARDDGAQGFRDDRAL